MMDQTAAPLDATSAAEILLRHASESDENGWWPIGVDFAREIADLLLATADSERTPRRNSDAPKNPRLRLVRDNCA